MPSKPRHRASLGRAGTTTAYRKGCRCASCTAANTEAKRRTRERKKRGDTRPLLTIVDDSTPPPPSDPPPDAIPGPQRDPLYGATEKALRADLETLEPSTDFGRNALIQGALALARQIDDLDFRGSKGPIVKTLVETIRAIRGKEAGDGESLEDLLASLSDPLPGAPAGY